MNYFILDGVDNALNEDVTVMIGDNLEYTVMNPKNGIESPVIINSIILLISIIIIFIVNKKNYFLKL